MRQRRRGGVPDWLGEEVFCEARQALQFVPVERPPRLAAGLGLSPILRRLYVAGGVQWPGAQVRLDVGFRLRPLRPRYYQSYYQVASADVAASALSLPVVVPRASDGPRMLAMTGRPLANRILDVTTVLAGRPDPLPPWWVQPGRPLVLVERPGLVPAGVPGASETDVPAVQHSFAAVEANQMKVPVWMVEYWPWTPRDLVRRLRIHLWRLHQEREVLRLVLRACIEGRLNLTANGPLRDYLARQSDRLRRNRVNGLPQRDLLGHAYEIDAIVNADDLASLKGLLDSLGRPGLMHSVMELVRDVDGGGTRTPGQVNVYYMEDGQMSVTDNSQNIGDNASIGAVVGGSATVTGGAFLGSGVQHADQRWDAAVRDMDLTRLTEELAQLLEKLRVESVEPTQFVETAEVAQAVEAARAGSLEGVRSHLAKVGAWALAAATAIGTAVAAAAIKAAAGI